MKNFKIDGHVFINDGNITSCKNCQYRAGLALELWDEWWMYKLISDPEYLICKEYIIKKLLE